MATWAPVQAGIRNVDRPISSYPGEHLFAPTPNEKEANPMSATRMVFLTVSVIILVGIWLTGFNKVHWFLYFPAAALFVAGATGFCPSAMLFKKLGFKE